MALLPLALWLVWAPHVLHVDREVRGDASIFILMSAALVALVLIVTRDPESGSSVADTTLRRVDVSKVLGNLSDYPLHWAVAFPITALWPMARGTSFFCPRRSAISTVIALLLIPASGYFTVGIGWAIALALLLTLSIDVLLDIGFDAIKRRDGTQLLLWAWMLIPAAAITYVQLPAKLLILSAPAAGLACVRRYELGDRRPLVERAFLVAVALSGILGALILTGSANLAEVGRDGGNEVARYVRAGKRVWADGAWGFQWYAMQAGAIPMATTPPFPDSGDVVVVGPEARVVALSNTRRTLLSRRIYDAAGSRVHGDMAGFFTNHVGPLPWAWGSSEYGRVEVWKLDSTFSVHK